jgi:hypothetical protein
VDADGPSANRRRARGRRRKRGTTSGPLSARADGRLSGSGARSDGRDRAPGRSVREPPAGAIQNPSVRGRVLCLGECEPSVLRRRPRNFRRSRLRPSLRWSDVCWTSISSLSMALPMPFLNLPVFPFFPIVRFAGVAHSLRLMNSVFPCPVFRTPGVLSPFVVWRIRPLGAGLGRGRARVALGSSARPPGTRDAGRASSAARRYGARGASGR